MARTDRYYVIDGRHRLLAGQVAGVEEFRADVHRSTSGRLRVGLEVIPTDVLEIDPDVQFEFAVQPRRWRAMAANWNPSKVGVIAVTPANGSGLTKQQKAEVKLGLDRDRRTVKRIESFMAEIAANDPVAVAIKSEVERAGFRIGKTGGGGTETTIEAVSALDRAYRLGLLERILALNFLWLGEPKTTNGMWLGGLTRFCEQGFDERLTSDQHELLREHIIPARVIRTALGKVATVTTGTPHTGQLAELICKALKAATRKRPGTA